LTQAPDAPPLELADLGEAMRVLRSRGLRITSPRRLVLEALFAADAPLSAEELAQGAGLEVTSVYRNLETLERHGVIRHVHLGHGPSLYTLVEQGEREYLYCERCGSVKAVPPSDLDPVRKQIKRRFGYRPRFTHFPIVGLCSNCARRS
jgi:Fur family ferric uptake transcriptional regulator